MKSPVEASLRHRLSLRERAGLSVHALLALALIPAYVLLAPPSHWDRPWLIALLFVLAVIAIRHDVPLPSGIAFDATAALALIAVALAGPLPALAVIFPPIAINALCGRERLIRAGNLANLAAYGWYTLAGALLLAQFAPGPASPDVLGWLVAAGVLQLLVNWAVGPAIYGTLWLGHPLRALVEMLRDALPAGVAMATLGGLTVVLETSFGILALALFALVAVLPQSALTFVARTRPVALLDPLTAARRYGGAMAFHLGLTRPERRELDAVIRLAHERAVDGDVASHLGHTVVDWSEVSCAAGHVTEWWNGSGGPAGLPGTIIPLSSRIAAVARTWAALTADGSPRLGHLDALAHLDGAAGVRLDPHVVRAARAVVAQERLTPAEPAPEPRLHHLRVPEPLRRALASAA
jgi:HD domain